MPLFLPTGLNSATRDLFNLIYAEEENLDDLKKMLAEYEANRQSIMDRGHVINLQARVTIQSVTRKITFNRVTCLDVAILKNKKSLANALAEYIFTNKQLAKPVKQAFFISAACICCANNRRDFLEMILAYKDFDINAHNIDWNFENTNLPLTIATKLGFEEIILQLLCHGANPAGCDAYHRSALFFAKSLLPVQKRKAITEHLHCQSYIQEALLAYQQKKSARIHACLARAIELSVELVSEYLHNISNLAIAQLQTETDTTDYSFLKEFIRIFVSILTSPLTTAAHTLIYQKFQQTTLVHLFGAYDCDTEVPGITKKLFATLKEKIDFFYNFGHATFFHDSSLEQTLLKMKEGNNFKPNSGALEKLSLLAKQSPTTEKKTDTSSTLVLS